MPAWEGWTLAPPGSDRYALADAFESENGPQAAFATGVVPPAEGLTLAAELEVAADQSWLLIGARRRNNDTTGRLVVRFDQQGTAA